MTFVVCETVAAITTHLRRVTDEWPLNYSGHVRYLDGQPRRPRALCNAEISWDTKLPISSTRCRTCRSKVP